MIAVAAGIRVLVAIRPIDFRKGADSLAAVAKEMLHQGPFSGTVIVFRAKRTDRVKLLWWDGTGLVMVWKRLEQGAFKWPPVTEGVMRLSSAQLATLIEGLDWSRVYVPRIGRPRGVRGCDRVNQATKIECQTIDSKLDSLHGCFASSASG